MPPVVATSIASDLADILERVERPGSFCTCGSVPIHAPRLEVTDVGPIALPLLGSQAEALLAVAEPAPYGRGEETLVDTAVRHTWQIGADRVRLSGTSWTRALEGIVASAAAGLGVAEPVRAEFYKLLLYDEGCFFVSHRDTEKIPGMFATLVIVLPSLYRGGELVVRHRDEEARLDLRCEDPSEAAYAAFYADCRHEVLPVTGGYRLSLIYNLTRQGQPPAPPDHHDAVAALTERLAAWREHDPDKLVYPLEHEYTEAELGFNALKGADAARVSVLRMAARRAECDLSLAFLAIAESGIAEHEYYGRRWGGSDRFEVVEVTERTVSLSGWRSEDGAPTMGDLPVEDAEISLPDILRDMEPDDESFHEATGNEGASFERTWRRTALVLWPRDRRLAVVNQGGLAATLPLLKSMAERWEGTRDSALGCEARELCAHVIKAWPAHVDYRLRQESRGPAARILDAMRRLEDRDGIARFLSEILAGGRLEPGDPEAVVRSLEVLEPDMATTILTQVLAGNAASAPDACAALLARAAAARRYDLLRPATALVDAMPAKPSRTAWREESVLHPAYVVDLLRAACAVDDALARRATETMLARPEAFGLDEMLVPALLELRGMSEIWEHAAVKALFEGGRGHLLARIARPLAPPSDCRRDSRLTCRCADCGGLARFLADPREATWTFKAAEARRRHIAEVAEQSRVDVNMTTSRRGTPYSLICTKNQATYERLAVQRKEDEEHLARLEG